MKLTSIYPSLIFGLALSISACSTTGKGENGKDIPVAGTDPVPAEALESSSPPSPSDASISNSPSEDSSSAMSGNAIIYKVQKGDTLMKIAYENLGNLYRWKEIYQANQSKIPNPSRLKAGTELIIAKSSSDTAAPGGNGEKYLIKKGDTLGTISNTVYGTQKRWKDLWENNKQLIHNPNQIFAGFFLYYIPDANSTAAAPKANDLTDAASAGAAEESKQEPAAAASGLPSPEALSGLAAPTDAPKPLTEAPAGSPSAEGVDSGTPEGALPSSAAPDASNSAAPNPQ